MSTSTDPKTRDPFEPTEADLSEIEVQVNIFAEEVFEETSRAFGWVANRAFRQAYAEDLRRAVRGALIRQHKTGFYRGCVHRDDAAQKAQGEWMGALLKGALTPNPDKRTA